MINKLFTPEYEQFIRKRYPELTREELTLAVNEHFKTNFKFSQIVCFVKRRKILCGRPPGSTKGTYKLFTPEQVAFIRDRYTELSRKELTEEINTRFDANFKASQVGGFIKNHKIKSGRTGRFEKGNIPHPNARSKGPNKTSFGEGNRPHNWLPVGTERPTSDGYLRVKVAEPNVWEFKHLQVWEAHHGPIPKGHNVTFADNNTLNCDPENLLLLTRAEHAVINKMQLSQVPADMKESVRLIAQIKIKARERVKEGMIKGEPHLKGDVQGNVGDASEDDKKAALRSQGSL